MPYINKELQQKTHCPDSSSLDVEIRCLADMIAGSYQDDELEGVLNYTITRLVTRTLGRTGWRYKFINRAVGVLECVKLEFYRRLAAPYEDKAIENNGDIPEYTKQ